MLQDEDITENASLREAGQKAGVSEADLDKMLAMAETPEVKERLKQRTQEAVDLGVSQLAAGFVYQGKAWWRLFPQGKDI